MCVCVSCVLYIIYQKRLRQEIIVITTAVVSFFFVCYNLTKPKKALYLDNCAETREFNTASISSFLLFLFFFCCSNYNVSVWNHIFQIIFFYIYRRLSFNNLYKIKSSKINYKINKINKINWVLLHTFSSWVYLLYLYN